MKKKLVLLTLLTSLLFASDATTNYSNLTVVEKLKSLDVVERRKVFDLIDKLRTNKTKSGLDTTSTSGAASGVLKSKIEKFKKGLNKEDKSVFDNILDTVNDLNIVETVSNLNVNDNFDKSKFGDSHIYAYKKNYIIPVVYDNASHSDNRKHYEAKLQISLLFPMYENFLSTSGDLYFGYTGFSVWQIYNDDTSAEFRDTNHQPELFLHFKPNYHLGNDFYLRNLQVGIIHQSNGQNIPESRSWNRNELALAFQKNNFKFGTNLWYRWDESAKKNTNDTQGDDNPDLEDYIGKGSVFVRYDKNNYTFELKHQNNFYNYNAKYGHTQAEFIFPSFNKNFKWYLQYFHGYGESLIDYNDRVNKIGFGVYLNEWQAFK